MFPEVATAMFPEVATKILFNNKYSISGGTVQYTREIYPVDTYTVQ